MRIEVIVELKSDSETSLETIEITMEEIKQLACNKARGIHSNRYRTIQAKSEVQFKLTK